MFRRIIKLIVLFNSMSELEDVVKKIIENTGMSEEEVMKKIKEKKEELSNLISDEGAAYIIAKEHGIDLIKRKSYQLKIKNIISGMRNVEVVGRIVRIDPVKEFKTEKSEGKLCPFYIGDETGIIRIVLWNDEVDKISKFNEGDVIKVKGYVVDNFGQPEIRLGNFGSIEKSDSKIISVDEIKKKFPIEKPTRVYERKNIKDIKEGDSAEVRATFVQVFYTNPFFYTCPICGKTLKDGLCPEHGKREANLVLSGVIDDGTGNIRAVLFRDNAEKVLGLTTEKAEELFKEGGRDKVLSMVPLGKEFIFKGYAKMNKIFDRLEFIINEVSDVDVKSEINKTLNEIE